MIDTDKEKNVFYKRNLEEGDMLVEGDLIK